MRAGTKEIHGNRFARDLRRLRGEWHIQPRAVRRSANLSEDKGHSAPEARVDINHANAEELAKVPGLTPSRLGDRQVATVDRAGQRPRCDRFPPPLVARAPAAPPRRTPPVVPPPADRDLPPPEDEPLVSTTSPRARLAFVVRPGLPWPPGLLNPFGFPGSPGFAIPPPPRSHGAAVTRPGLAVPAAPALTRVTPAVAAVPLAAAVSARWRSNRRTPPPTKWITRRATLSRALSPRSGRAPSTTPSGSSSRQDSFLPYASIAIRFGTQVARVRSALARGAAIRRRKASPFSEPACAAGPAFPR